MIIPPQHGGLHKRRVVLRLGVLLLAGVVVWGAHAMLVADRSGRDPVASPARRAVAPPPGVATPAPDPPPRVASVADGAQPQPAVLNRPPRVPLANASRVLRLSTTLQRIKDSNAAIEYVGGGGGEGVLNLYLDVAPDTPLLQVKRIGAQAIRIFEHYAYLTQRGQYSLTVTLTDASARRNKGVLGGSDSPVILVGSKLRYGPETVWVRGGRYGSRQP